MPGALLDVFDVIERLGGDHGMWSSENVELRKSGIGRVIAANRSPSRKGKVIGLPNRSSSPIGDPIRTHQRGLAQISG